MNVNDKIDSLIDKTPEDNKTDDSNEINIVTPYPLIENIDADKPAEEINNEFLGQLLRHKEFYELRNDVKSRDQIKNNEIQENKNYDELPGIKLHSHQLFVRNFMNPNTPYKRLYLLHATGCHARGTKIMMYTEQTKKELIIPRPKIDNVHDSTIDTSLLSQEIKNSPVILSSNYLSCTDAQYKKVEDLKVGDLIMGDDFEPRKILECLTGRQQMYKFIPLDDVEYEGISFGYKPYIFNEDHILSLIDAENKIVDVSIKDYLTWTPKFKDKYLAFRVSRAILGGKQPKLCCRQNNGQIIKINVSAVPSILNINRKEIKNFIHESRAHGFWTAKIKNKYTLQKKKKRSDKNMIKNIKTVCIYGPATKICRYHFSLERLDIGDYYGFSLLNNPRFLGADFNVMHNTGKTLAAVSIAHEFVSVYREIYNTAAIKIQAKGYSSRVGANLYLDRTTPSIFVLGFSGVKNAFIRELLKYPEFGFISREEQEHLFTLRRVAAKGVASDIEHAKDFYRMIKRRITNKTKKGFYKFYGYDEFVNRMFNGSVSLISLEAEVKERISRGEDITLEKVVDEAIANKQLHINENFVSMFKNSLLICDEFHHTYNTIMKNNRGIAIQWLLDSIPSLRFVPMSATPITNSPSEIVELLNYLTPRKYSKKEFFSSPSVLLPGALEKIKKIVIGRVSFLQDVSLEYFPRREFAGEVLVVKHDGADIEIPYLRFISCEISDFQILGIDELARQNKQPINDISIPLDGYALYDIMFPGPPDVREKHDSDKMSDNIVPIFRSSEIKMRLAAAPQNWCDKIGINISGRGANQVIKGTFLDEKNIGKYSSKYKKMLECLRDIILQNKTRDPLKVQKTMIFHRWVKLSGVILVAEILSRNGFIDHLTEPASNTICVICGVQKEFHKWVEGENGRSEKNGDDHNFVPARFILVHSYIEKNQIEDFMNKFNAQENKNGLKYFAFIGSKIIEESYDFKDVQNLMILSLPVNIPTLIQVFGRCIRKHSHINLPPDQRNVKIWLLVSTFPRNITIDGKDRELSAPLMSPEISLYYEKLRDYMVIQKIEKVLNESAIDADIHRNIIMPPQLVAEYFPDGKDKDPRKGLGALYFEPGYVLPEFTLQELNLSTFNAYRYCDEEVASIIGIIKRLFIRRAVDGIGPVYKYEDLWRDVQRPFWPTEINCNLFEEDNFIIALDIMVVDSKDGESSRVKSNQKIMGNNSDSNLVTEKKMASIEYDAQFDSAEIFGNKIREIYFGPELRRYKIKKIGDYYVMFPYDEVNVLDIGRELQPVEHTRDKEFSMILKSVGKMSELRDNTEYFLRDQNMSENFSVDFGEYLRSNLDSKWYDKFFNEFSRKLNTAENLEKVVTSFFWDYSDEFQKMFIENMISDFILASIKKGRDVNWQEKKNVYEKVLQYLEDLSVMVKLVEIKKYKDVGKFLRESFLEKITDNIPVGYVTEKAVKICIINEKGTNWIEINKFAINRQINWVDNNIVIGSFEYKNNKRPNFKLRIPPESEIYDGKSKKIRDDDGYLAEIEKNEITDSRLIGRGATCETRRKPELLIIAAKLGIQIEPSMDDDITDDKINSNIKSKLKNIKINIICGYIRARLFDLEIKARKANSRLKFIYFWWDIKN